jgi:hypothetical protein
MALLGAKFYTSLLPVLASGTNKFNKRGSVSLSTLGSAAA